MVEELKKRVFKYLTEDLGVNSSEKLLLAVSGGMDSISMFHLLLDLNFNFQVAHCNFGLRSEESEGDEKFVRDLCEKHTIECHVAHFKTRDYQVQERMSTQEAARVLRYQYFNEILDKEELDYVAVAHHKDDAIETFFINLMRGSGLSGLSGIPAVNGNVIRPLLCAEKSEIEKYVEEKSIQYRNDSSNDSDKYLRNELRHHVIPKLNTIKPGFNKVLSREMRYFDELDKFFTHQVITTMSEIITLNEDKGIFSINKEGLIKIPGFKAALSKYLHFFGFNLADVDDIVLGLQKNTKAKYLSSTYQLLRTRDELLLMPIQSNTSKSVEKEILRTDKNIEKPMHLVFSRQRDFNANILSDSKVAQINFMALKFPLVVRKWRFGDYFYPLGMQNKKKLSDFFTDIKLETTVKDEVYVITSDNQIVWVVGLRIDDRFKVTDEVKEVYKIEWK